MNLTIRLYVILFFTIASCAPTRLIKPLEKNEKAVGVNLGGPLIQMGVPVLLPLSSVYYAQGITTKTSVFGSLHTTSLLFGVFQTDIGVCTSLFRSNRLKAGVTANPAINMAFDRWEWNKRLWPQLDLNIYKELGTASMVYGGMSNWFELTRYRIHHEANPMKWIPNFQLGYQYSKNKWNYGIETKLLAPWTNNKPNVADYIGLNQRGAFGLYLNLMRKF